jgi:hypothetical protein
LSVNNINIETDVGIEVGKVLERNNSLPELTGVTALAARHSLLRRIV